MKQPPTYNHDFAVFDHLKVADPKEVIVEECQLCMTPWNLSSPHSRFAVVEYPIVLQGCGHIIGSECLRVAVDHCDRRCPICDTPIPIEIDNSLPTYDDDGAEVIEMVDLTVISSDELSSAPSSPIQSWDAEQWGEQEEDYAIDASLALGGKVPPRPLAELFTESDADSDAAVSVVDLMDPEDPNTAASRGKVVRKAGLSDSDGSIFDPDLTDSEDWNTDAFRAKFIHKALPSANRNESDGSGTTEEETQAALAFLAENAPGSTLDDLKGALALMDLRYGSHTSFADLEGAMTLTDIRYGRHTSLAEFNRFM